MVTSLGNLTIYQGDCRAMLPSIVGIDAVVTDPPYELGFMGKDWDKAGISFEPETWRLILDACKPGAHLLAFGGTRTFHRIACAIEDAGWEIRDTVMWVYGQGFPKSLDVAKQLDKMAGVGFTSKPASGVGFMKPDSEDWHQTKNQLTRKGESSPEAQQWEGWGTALKPAWEPIILARKPLEGTVAENVLKYGTGALNIDVSRIPTNGEVIQPVFGGHKGEKHGSKYGESDDYWSKVSPQGRFPANLIHDGSDEVLAKFPNESGRFFYCAKSSRAERDAGLEGMPLLPRPTMGSGIGGQPDQQRANNRNNHPTVKPLALMRYLIKLITPPNGVILDPFMGSGSTLVAAGQLGFKAIGIEIDEKYCEIAMRRCGLAGGVIVLNPILPTPPMPQIPKGFFREI